MKVKWESRKRKRREIGERKMDWESSYGKFYERLKKKANWEMERKSKSRKDEEKPSEKMVIKSGVWRYIENVKRENGMKNTE